MRPLVSHRATKRAARRTASQVNKLVKFTAKATRTALRQADRQARKNLREARRAVEALAEPEHKAPGRFVAIDGMRVHYIVRGRGRPVLLLHGNGTMAEDFVICGLVDRLATRYRVIAIDRPGFGHTPRPRHCLWTATAQARLVHRVLEALNVERPLVVAHSWGTLVALALAAHAWRELRGLVLLSGYYYPSRRADIALSVPLAVPGIGDAARSLMPKTLARIAAAQSFRQVFRPQPVPARFAARFPVEIAMDATQLRAATEDAAAMNAAASGLQHAYVRLRLPVAILAGDADRIVDSDAQSGRLYRDVAGSTLTILPGRGHMIHYAARAAVERTVDGMMAPAARSAMQPGKVPSRQMPRPFRTV